MFRLGLLFLLLPAAAAAEWAPHPSLFNYETVFEMCTTNTKAEDLVARCAEDIEAAYVLKRAVAEAAYACANTPLSECPGPFEDAGLTAIAPWIANDMGCEGTPIGAMPTDVPLPPDHCVTVTADILFDEGVVPIFAELECGADNMECLELAVINATLWTEAVNALSDDDPTIDDLQARNVNDCLAGITNIGMAGEQEAMTCIAERAAALWVDLKE